MVRIEMRFYYDVKYTGRQRVDVRVRNDEGQPIGITGVRVVTVSGKGPSGGASGVGYSPPYTLKPGETYYFGDGAGDLACSSFKAVVYYVLGARYLSRSTGTHHFSSAAANRWMP